jgi:hypothetical protein
MLRRARPIDVLTVQTPRMRLNTSLALGGRSRVPVFVLLVFLALARCRSASYPVLCTAPPLPIETQILILDSVVSTSILAGKVLPAGAEGWAPEGQPRLEIWRSDGRGPHHVVSVRLDGTWPPMQLAAGTYCFRASALGYTSIMARVRIARHAPAIPLDVRLPFGI